MKDCKRSFPALAFLALLFCSAGGLFAFGKQEEAAKEPLNAVWTLCVTSFDISALPPHRQITGDTVMRSIADGLGAVDFRFRASDEYAYYRDYAWAQSRAEKAQALAEKQNERAFLLYKGEASWKYRKDLKTVEKAIAVLEEELAAIDAEVPAVEGKPEFSLAEENKNGSYPAPPVAGGEYRFCADKKADAFLAGSLSEYHGRIYLNIKMYTLYTASWSYEDSVLFSSGDLNSAMDEISGRLAAAVSESLPSAILVRASPADAMVIIGGSLAGRGETEPYLHSPGAAELELRADNHVPLTIPLELNPGELAEVSVDLTAREFNFLELEVPGSLSSRVYLGGLYLGDAPYTLRLPGADFAYVSVETPEGETGSVVYRDNGLVKGKAEFTRIDDFRGRADLLTGFPVSPEEKRVDRARRGFYGAYGAFWVALPAALLAAGIAGNYVSALNAAAMNNDQVAYEKIYNSAEIGYYVEGAAYGVIGVSLGITLFQIFRYLYVSGGDSTPLVKSASAEAEK